MKKLIYGILAVSLLAACNKNTINKLEEELANPQEIEIKFTTTHAQTKAAIESSQLPEQSIIGIYGLISKEENLSTTGWTSDVLLKDRLDNGKYTIKDNQMVAEQVAKYPYDTNLGLVFYAYYPFTATPSYTPGNAPQIPVSVSSTMQETPDYLYADRIASMATSQAVNLNFRHAMARLDIVIKKAERSGIPDAEIKKIMITTKKGQSAKMSIEDGTIIYEEENKGITNVSYILTPNSDEAQINSVSEYNDTKSRFLLIPEEDAIEKIVMMIQRKDKNYELENVEYDTYIVKDNAQGISDTIAINLIKGKVTTLKIVYDPYDTIFSTSVADWENDHTNYELPAK